MEKIIKIIVVFEIHPHAYSNSTRDPFWIGINSDEVGEKND